MKIEITKEFIYYVNGYEKKVFSSGIHELPQDIADYAVQNKLAKKVNTNDNRAGNSSRSKDAVQS